MVVDSVDCLDWQGFFRFDPREFVVNQWLLDTSVWYFSRLAF